MLGVPRRPLAAAPDRGLSPKRGRWHSWPGPFPWVGLLLLGPPAGAVSGSGWEPGGRTELTAGPPSLALSLRLSGASLLFVVSSGHPPNAMLGRDLGVRFRSLEVTSQMLGTRSERRGVRASFLASGFHCSVISFGFLGLVSNQCCTFKDVSLIEPYIGTSAARRVVGSEEKTRMPE